ncbi:hypothetical protein [Sphingomonas solaris]|uniref:Uncharacterized protein n=1 Tax=Alterirhizorhabdus solaris TaxID=2529389 RepID=A0A558RBX5_9SPHN|nr:hypothetical protein [Sphingomonas solaris]TVV76925.1 hypothetical protein FOY91_02440 [Sphingomonas solaris]
MSQLNLSIYNATRDNPGGPLVLMEDTSDAGIIQPILDDDGRMTLGSAIGQIIAFVILGGSFAYCAYIL